MSCNLHTSQKYSSIDFFPQAFKNVKTILSLHPCENIVGLIWPVGSSLLICELLEGIKKPEIINMSKNK